MRTIQLVDNGNLAVVNRHEVHRFNSDNRSRLNISTESRYIYSNSDRTENLNSNYNSSNFSEDYTDRTFQPVDSDENVKNVNVELIVCNQQYRLHSQNVKINSSKTNLESSTDTFLANTENFIEGPNAFSFESPIDDERTFGHSDTDEMSEKSVQPVPRGIVNPNYPGFQHLAHTLQDYSTNIESFYSENEMTDDDVDIEIAENTYELELNQNEITRTCKNINHNNNNNDVMLSSTFIDREKKVEIPDLLKSVSKNNNHIEPSGYEYNCSAADIENNFNTKDIIGDFNKEIEDEIKLLLNYNINIQDDLEELRRDIKDTFTKPIENTINHISDVVNHVIKRLVETQSDIICEQNVTTLKSVIGDKQSTNITLKETNDVDKENESNTKTEVNLSRPTFLLIDNNTDEIADAFLSDGKDEINLYENEYDTENLSRNVENTIKQLSTELKKIIPKLDEMRERDRLWNENIHESSEIITDGNSNEIAGSSNCYKFTSSNTNYHHKEDISKTIKHKDTNVINKTELKHGFASRVSKERSIELNSVKTCIRNAQSNTSVRKIESAKEYDLGSFDVYNIETALPKLDLDAIENHLKAAKEAERRKRNDREEIRRRLAMGTDTEEYYSMVHTDRPGKKPSLHSRLQSGKNLQICFMNETASDNESQSDVERSSSKSSSRSSIFDKSSYNHPYQTRPLSVNITKSDKISAVQSVVKLRPSSLTTKTTKSRSSHSLGHIELKESDFYALQATLQTEARIALAQAKEMARIQMERERRSRAVSPVTEMLRRSMEKANAPLAADRRRVSRQLLTDMNIAQLQVIVNELHSQIESLNDSLVKLLMARDELHMGQDSMLVDIEDLTRYLGVKEQSKKTKGSKSAVKRLTSLVQK